MTKLLIVEDEATIVQSLCAYLQGEGFQTISAASEADAIEMMAGVDLALVDIALTEGNGFGVCSAAKEREIPVIFLTASGDERSVVHGLDMGADDYISKPFRPRELVSRIRSVLRRAGKSQSIVSLGSILVDAEKGVVTKDDRELPLSALEFRLLMDFLNNRGKLLSRTRLLEDIWDMGGDFVNDNTLTVYIKRLREKIESDPSNPTIIKTVRGMGYRMD